MKKIFIVLLSVVSIGLTGCTTKTDKPVSTNKPVTTPVVESTPTPEATKNPDETSTPEGTVTPDQEKNAGIDLTDTYVSGTFVEKTDNYPTTITFNEDGTFKSNVNICSGMMDITGTYRLEGDTVSLYIPEETGIYYLDHDQPFYFDVTKDSLKHKYDAAFSCADVGEYIPK